MRSVVAFCLLAVPAAAEAPLSGEAFDRLTRGKTFIYAEDGTPYGAEEYKGGRRVVWSFLDGSCLEGTWYEAGDAICFVYDGLEAPQCWHFFGDNGLTASFLGGGTTLTEMERSRRPLECRGPQIGV